MFRSQLTKSIITVLLLAIGSILLGVFVPGFINYQNKSFSREDIINRLDEKTRSRIIADEQRLKTINDRKFELLKTIQDTSLNLSPQKASEIREGIENLNIIEEYSRDKSFNLSPFYPKSKLLLLWPFLYFGLSVLVILIKPRYKCKIPTRFFITLFLLLVVFMRWPTWVRNTFIGKMDRVVYSVANYDVSKLGFFIQEAESVISIILITIIICKWVSYAENLKRKLLANTKFSELYYLKVIKELRFIYQEWQLCSIFLAIAFGYYTYFFWATINETNDFRYLPHAIIIHVVWGMIWLVISFPLLIVKNYQVNFRENFLRQQLSSNFEKSDNNKLDLIFKEDPISTQNQTLTALIGGITFLLPVLKAFL
jgi:hypothetical protein